MSFVPLWPKRRIYFNVQQNVRKDQGCFQNVKQMVLIIIMPTYHILQLTQHELCTERCSRELQNSVWVQLHSEIMVSSQKAPCHRLGKRPLAPALDLCTSTLLSALGSWRLDLKPSGGTRTCMDPWTSSVLLFSSPRWTLAPCTMCSAGISCTLLTWDVRRDCGSTYTVYKAETQCEWRQHLMSDFYLDGVWVWLWSQKPPTGYLGVSLSSPHIRVAFCRWTCYCSGSSWTRSYFLALTLGSALLSYIVWNNSFVQCFLQHVSYQLLSSLSLGVSFVPNHHLVIAPYVQMGWENQQCVQAGMGYLKWPQLIVFMVCWHIWYIETMSFSLKNKDNRENCVT